MQTLRDGEIIVDELIDGIGTLYKDGVALARISNRIELGATVTFWSKTIKGYGLADCGFPAP
jgi:hypothetical protein